MGDVLELKPVDETLEFGSRAATRRDHLVGRFLLLEKKTRTSAISFDEMDYEIRALQDEYAKELARMETMQDVCDAVHQKRAYLQDNMPEGSPTIIVATHVRKRRAVAFNVVRRGVRFLCSDFQIFEFSDRGVAIVFGHYAAA